MEEANTMDTPQELKRVIKIFEVEKLRCQTLECGHIERGKGENSPEDEGSADFSLDEIVRACPNGGLIGKHRPERRISGSLGLGKACLEVLALKKTLDLHRFEGLVPCQCKKTQPQKGCFK